ncbi:MAG: hypothetical protein L0170_00955 [Acidobacteria bacterium]|nr:hypothetical protein [Acidobacteriota bacterium]
MTRTVRIPHLRESRVLASKLEEALADAKAVASRSTLVLLGIEDPGDLGTTFETIERLIDKARELLAKGRAEMDRRSLS